MKNKKKRHSWGEVETNVFTKQQECKKCDLIRFDVGGCWKYSKEKVSEFNPFPEEFENKGCDGLKTEKDEEEKELINYGGEGWTYSDDSDEFSIRYSEEGIKKVKKINSKQKAKEFYNSLHCEKAVWNGFDLVDCHVFKTEE